MKLTEFADVINKDIELIRYPNQDDRWCCKIVGAEVKGLGTLISEFGNGSTPLEAMADYVNEIAGKTLVFGGFTEKRVEYVAPKYLKP